MQILSESRSQVNVRRRSAFCCPRLEALEGRFPPGDTVLGAGLLARSLEPSFAVLDADFMALHSPRTDALRPGSRQSLLSGVESDRLAFVFTFAVSGRPPQQGDQTETQSSNASTFVSTVAGQEPTKVADNRLPLDDLLQLNRELFDDLLADDFAELSIGRTPSRKTQDGGAASDAEAGSPLARSAEPGNQPPVGTSESPTGTAPGSPVARPHGNGTLVFNSDGSFTYTPNSGYSGTDSFTYVANDGALDSAPATVTLTVHATNTAPVAVEDRYATRANTPLSVGPSRGLLLNDFDDEGDVLTADRVGGPT